MIKRRAYLNEFSSDGNGGWAYGGAVYEPSDGGMKRYMLTAGITALALTLLTAGGGCIPAAGSTNSFYVILPLLAEAIAVVLADAAVVKLLLSEKPLRDYAYERSVKRLPFLLLAASAFSLLGAVCTLLYVLLNGFCGMLVGTLGYIAAKLAVAVAAPLAVLRLKKTEFVRKAPEKGSSEG